MKNSNRLLDEAFYSLGGNSDKFCVIFVLDFFFVLSLKLTDNYKFK